MQFLHKVLTTIFIEEIFVFIPLVVIFFYLIFNLLEKKFSTFTFAHFAAKRWPNSCIKIRKAIMRKKYNNDILHYNLLQIFLVRFSVFLYILSILFSL